MNNFSGGQKAIVTLACTIYSDVSIPLLDILAALDTYTVRFIVDKCLQGKLLQGCATILVVCVSIAQSDAAKH